MIANHNRQLDHLLLNLCQHQNQKADWQQALKHRDKNATKKHQWTFLTTNQYNKYGPGIKLYFQLLKYLIILFAILTISSLPAMISNAKGNGLSIYGGNSPQSHYTKSIMRYSLANQPLLEMPAEFKSLEEHQEHMKNIAINQYITIAIDIFCIVIFISFLIFWEIKSENLVEGIIEKQGLTCYHTLIAEFNNNGIINEQIVRNHFEKIGKVVEVQLVYDYGDFLFQLKQFMILADNYSQETDKQAKKSLYKDLQSAYNKIKKKYKQEITDNSKHPVKPFVPLKAFIVFEDKQLRNKLHSLYKYKISGVNLQLNGQVPDVKKCHDEPLSIIWQNYHLKDNIFKKFGKSLLFGFFVFMILALALFAIFLISLHMNQLAYQNSPEINTDIHLSYHDVASSNNVTMVNQFCSQQTYKTFQWKYIDLCKSYFTGEQEKWFYMLILAVIVVVITLIIIRIVFSLAELRRFKTVPEKKRFLIITIFITYFISSAVLALLIRAEFMFQERQFSLYSLATTILGDLNIQHLQFYDEPNRKWYMNIGKLLIVNFLLSLVICPWLYIIEEYLMSKINMINAYFARTQKQMNEKIKFNEFYIQFYYAIVINSIYFCMLFSVAMPIFYFLALLSMISFFFSCKIIFHNFSRIPQMYDHKINQMVSRCIGGCLIIHMFSAIWFVYVQEIFPSTNSQGIIYYIYLGIALIFIFNMKKISNIIKKRYQKKIQEVVMTQQLNTTLHSNHKKPHKQKNASNHQIVYGQHAYLESYKMENNQYYNNLSYMLMLLQKNILYHEDIIEEMQNSYHHYEKMRYRIKVKDQEIDEEEEQKCQKTDQVDKCDEVFKIWSSNQVGSSVVDKQGTQTDRNLNISI